MSAIRVMIGVLIGACMLAGEITVFWCFSLPMKWVFFVFIIPTGLAVGFFLQMQSRQALKPYWNRACTGIRWRRRFPAAPKTEIREFLDLFIEAFMFRQRRRFCFLPDDKVLDIYRALYPPGSLADSLELETFCMKLEKRYGINFATSWPEDITLGEIYAKTHSGVG